jgi:hypothetical protein
MESISYRCDDITSLCDAQVRLHALAVVLPIILSAQRALGIGLRLNVHQTPGFHLRYFCHEVYGTL